LDAVAADDRVVVRALVRQATAIAANRWKDARRVIDDLVDEAFREAAVDLVRENQPH
jgi:hypothetical protein